MKKSLFILFLFLFIPLGASYADFQFGPMAAYKFPISATPNSPGSTSIGLKDFWFGADARIKSSIFQATFSGFYIPANSNQVPNRMSLDLTGGLAFDLAMLRLGLGLGPVWIFSLTNGNANPIDFGTFIRFNTDLKFGRMALSLSLSTHINLTGRGALLDFNNFALLAGLGILFQLG